MDSILKFIAFIVNYKQTILEREVDLNEREADLKTLPIESLASYRSSFPLLRPHPPMQLQPLHHRKLHAGVISVGMCQMQNLQKVFNVIMMFYHFNYKLFKKLPKVYQLGWSKLTVSL